jgi:hypothetical protein
MKRVFLAFAFVALSLSFSAQGQTSSCTSSLYPPDTGGSICVTTSDPYISSDVVSSGVAMWNTCGQAGSGFPQLDAMTTGCSMEFDIVHVSGVSTNSSGSCGQFTPVFDNSKNPPTIAGGTITVWDSTQYGNDCEAYRNETIAHEIGHGLGLADSSCVGHIMGPPIIGGSRSVNADECSQADSQWSTPSETQTQTTDPPNPGGPLNQCGADGCAEPILIRLSRGEYQLSGSNDPVSFDINNDGHPDLISWTARGADMAFLALDRNGNGAIDDGGEIFGNGTYLSTGSKAPNGFVALAELDDNGDGVVDARDSAWSRLLLWTDLNHDGKSEPTELLPLSASKVIAIDLAYHWSGRVDAAGNHYGYEGRLHEGTVVRSFYDVFFLWAHE